MKNYWKDCMRRALKIASVLLLLYPLTFAGFYIAMCQSPEIFSGIMSKTSNVVFAIFPFKRMWLSARKGSLKVGDAAPDFSLETYDRKSRVQLSAFRGKRPVVLVFGSYTRPPFRREVPALNRLYRQYRNQAEFYLVYIQEAHASDGWQTEANEKEKVIYDYPKGYDERVSVAETCSTNLGIEFPALVDTIDNKTEAAYTAWPDRLYLIDSSGQVVFKSEAGPFGFKTDLLSKALESISKP